MVRFLLSLPDIQKIIDLTDKAGVTPLMMAAQNGYFDIVEMLLLNKACVNIKTLRGNSAYLLVLRQINFSRWLHNITKTCPRFAFCEAPLDFYFFCIRSFIPSFCL